MVTEEEIFMSRALDQAHAAGRRGEVPIGALVVQADTGEILAEAGNSPIAQHDPTAHAEILALRAACRHVANYRLNQCHLYVTLEPCAMCATAISFARIARLIFGAEDEKGGAVVHGPRLFDQVTCHYRPDVLGGIMAEPAGQLLKDFFAARRA
ncbi:MAG TPA: nucleoside deaminase [Gammaproteobacteria bacterium]|jgi:tRNA(Arg) A34 adenosine deaminase TadA|nr:nucleoside deaminase [Gammaproteobacteria bacterium]